MIFVGLGTPIGVQFENISKKRTLPKFIENPENYFNKLRFDAERLGMKNGKSGC